MAENETLEQLVDKTVREHFTNAEIISVDVREDTEYEDDEILRITVLFSNEKKLLGPELRLKFLSILRPKLEEIDVHAFPVMRYIPQVEGDPRFQNEAARLD